MVESTVNLDIFEPNPAGKSHGGCSSCGTGSAGANLARCGNGLEKIYPTTAVRFGYMRFIGEFSHQPDLRFTCGARVVIQTKRGIELGEQVSLTCNGCDKSVSREDMKRWVESSGEDTYMFNAGRILREATAADLAEFAHIQASTRAKRHFAQQIANKHHLPMKVVDCECPLGGERIIFFFTAGERIDFRGLVKELAGEYRTRIEMRQIGARDEARLLADYETCGREVCCKVFLKTLRPISMRMAKLQKATLDPSQVSGRCGRLKCCLRYEHTTYEELDKLLPRVGVRIRTNEDEGVIINRQVLTQLAQIRLDDDRVVTVVFEDIIAVDVPRPATPTVQEKLDSHDGGPATRRRRADRKITPSAGKPLRDVVEEPPPPKQDTDKTSADSGTTLETSKRGQPTDPSQPADGRARPARRRRRRRRRPGNNPRGDGSQSPESPSKDT